MRDAERAQRVGLARLSLYHVHADLISGRLVRVMEAFNPHEAEPIHAVYLGKAGRLPARVRAVLDFLVEQVGRSPRFQPIPKTAAGTKPRRATP